MNSFSGFLRRCIDDYEMIQDGDRIAVGVSGGKDSLALLAGLHHLQGYYPRRFELEAITLDLGFEGMDFSPLAAYCEELGVPFTLRHTDIKQVVFDERRESNPCSLCAKMRRGSLHDIMKERGLNKIALGHHFDDAVETFLLSLVQEGRISCFRPVTYMSRAMVTQIRPMLYIGEGTVRSLVERYSLPVVENRCPQDGRSRRQDVKELIKTLDALNPGIKTRVFGAMQRLPLEGWQVINRRYTDR